MCEIVAQARGWSVEQAARITLENAQRVFAFPRIAPGPPEMDDDEGAFVDSLAGLRVRDDDEAKANATSNNEKDDEEDDEEEEEEEDDDSDNESDGASSGWWVKRP